MSLILLFINVYKLQTQKPDCNFNDTNGYFYHWAFDGDNRNFDFELTNSTSSEIKSKITNYENQRGDGETNTISNNGFPQTHIYPDSIFNLFIKMTYEGIVYDFSYIVYDTKPEFTAKIVT
tara:strand:+ start:1538 stop:1900 length:363 start_codon:yes stop_codon:yes gene_type:complete